MDLGKSEEPRKADKILSSTPDRKQGIIVNQFDGIIEEEYRVGQTDRAEMLKPRRCDGPCKIGSPI